MKDFPISPTEKNSPSSGDFGITFLDDKVYVPSELYSLLSMGLEGRPRNPPRSAFTLVSQLYTNGQYLSQELGWNREQYDSAFSNLKDYLRQVMPETINVLEKVISEPAPFFPGGANPPEKE